MRPLDVSGGIPGLGRSPGEGNGNLLQYSCLGNPRDRGAWQAAVHGVTKNWIKSSSSPSSSQAEVRCEGEPESAPSPAAEDSEEEEEDDSEEDSVDSDDDRSKVSFSAAKGISMTQPVIFTGGQA